jgi:hypothetical protein
MRKLPTSGGAFALRRLRRSILLSSSIIDLSELLSLRLSLSASHQRYVALDAHAMRTDSLSWALIWYS